MGVDFTRLKEEVLAANLALNELGLVISTWGNVSAFDPKSSRMIIKASGVPYDEMSLEDMVVVDIEGRVIDSDRRPSSDTPTHLYLYKHLAEKGVLAIAHTHSLYATIWAQACIALQSYGTTHADYFHGAVPCTRAMRAEEIAQRYEEETGKVIVETIGENDPLHVPAILVASHGPFTWGKTAEDAVLHSQVLEYSAQMALHTRTLAPAIEEIDSALGDKHFFRKFGPDAYYGQ